MSHPRVLTAAIARLRTSRIGLRVLAFNLLVLFLPVAGILYLDVYEARLLETQERGMVEQARLLAAALGARDDLTSDDAMGLMRRLGAQGDSRFRVFDPDGRLLADSRRVLGPGQPIEQYRTGDGAGRDPLLYRVGTWLVRLARGIDGRKWNEPSPSTSSFAEGPQVPNEVRAALQGRYGAASRRTPRQRSLTLNSAVPIRSGERITGAVVVSQSTFRILQALYSLRLRIFEIVIASAILAALLSTVMSATIVRPLVRLRAAASSLAERRAPLAGTFAVVDRRDEIGDLARALEELTSRLDAHIRLLESFAADVSHEFKNPLASIRMAAEMLASSESAHEREKFFALLTRDVDRLGRLVSGVRELARIDAQLAQERAVRVDIGALLSELADGLRLIGVRVFLSMPERDPLVVRGSRDRFLQVFENILQNARSFALEGDIAIALERSEWTCHVSICDTGPGIPDAHLERVFERFFSYRPADGARQEHAGLGLAIARTIVEGYGGTITARNRPGGGACFVVELPLITADGRNRTRRSREVGPAQAQPS